VETMQTIAQVLDYSIYDLMPDDVWGLFAIVTLLYVGLIFLYFFRLALASVPQSARGIVIAVAALVGFVTWGVISQEWFRNLIVGNLAAIGAIVGLMFILMPSYSLGQRFAAGGTGAFAAAIPYVVSLAYLFASHSLIITLVYLGLFAYELLRAVPDALQRLAASGSSQAELGLVYPGLVVLLFSGLLLTPMVITAYPAIQILVFAGTFVAGAIGYDRFWHYSPHGTRRQTRIAGYVFMGILGIVAVIAYASDFAALPSQLILVISGQLGTAASGS
jgi:hypothetical protein